VLAPAGTPKPVIDKLYQAVIKALKAPEVIERIGPRAGNDLVGNTSAEFAQVIKRDLAKYARLIKETGIEPR